MRSGLVRIVDPAGLAVAWLDPVSARCVEFMVRLTDQERVVWRPVFAAPEARLAGYGLVALVSDGSSGIEGAQVREDRPGAGWFLLERDPTSVILQTGPREAPGVNPADVSGRLVARLDDASLSFVLTVQNDSAVAQSVTFGLRGVFPFGLEIEPAIPQVMMPGPIALPHAGVTRDQGVRPCEPGVGDVQVQAVEILGAPPGQHALLQPGVQERLMVSLSMFSVAGGGTEILRVQGRTGT